MFENCLSIVEAVGIVVLQHIQQLKRTDCLAVIILSWSEYNMIVNIALLLYGMLSYLTFFFVVFIRRKTVWDLEILQS